MWSYDVAGLREWFSESAEEVTKKACDAVDCGKVEEKLGEWKLCKGCMEWWYCGRECQVRDWKVGGHKSVCKKG